MRAGIFSGFWPINQITIKVFIVACKFSNLRLLKIWNFTSNDRVDYLMAVANKKTSFQRFIRSLNSVMAEYQVTADALIGAALSSWCKQSFKGLPRPGLPAPVILQQNPAVVDFVDFIKQLDLPEATYWFSSAYAHLIGDNNRKQLAMFFTPPSLTKRLLDDLEESGVDYTENSFCDPACGGAAFLTPIAMRMRNALLSKKNSPKKILFHAQRNLYGTDKDETLCKLSRHFLLMVFHKEITTSGVTPKFHISCADALHQPSSLARKVDVVVCNPPFRKMKSAEVDLYIDKYSEIVEGQPNLYALFMVLCINLLASSGRCALVTPTSFLSGQYFSKLRTYLISHTKLLGIGMVSDRSGIFIDVEQETALTLMQRHEGLSDRVVPICVVSRDGQYVNVGKCLLPSSESAWPIPRSESDIELLRLTSSSKFTIVDYGYRVRVGAFVWNRDRRPTYLSHKDVVNKKADSAVPLIWSSDIASGARLRFDGKPKFNKEPCFVDLGSRFHRSVVQNPSVILQRVTSNDQSRRLIATVVPSKLFETYGGFVGENHIVILEQVIETPALEPERLALLLKSSIIDRYFRCISGATNVSVFELKQLPLPDPVQLKKFLARGLEFEKAVQNAFAIGQS
ncbi:HsdM family class I SAM-dependent methyltransferase [Cellvibrio sp. ARAG 10.3]|uniref:HsdM family class I SAM-dependent methyltransferase n=1 Tax=Cellvibrio sp. ARAG 10.3 TaxID=3451358 RepID=UPI003F4645B9